MSNHNNLLIGNHDIDVFFTKNKLCSLKQFRLLLFFFIVISLLFLLLTNYSFMIKNSVISFYREINISKEFYNSRFNLSENFNNRITIRNTSSNLNLCPLIPPGLNDRIQINMTQIPEEKLSQLENITTLNIKQGGLRSPSNCESRHRVAIVIPYRNRKEHLELFLMHMHPFLSKQVNYTLRIIILGY